MGSIFTSDLEKEKQEIQKNLLLPEGCEFIFDYTYTDRDNAILGFFQKGIEQTGYPIISSITSQLLGKYKLDDMTKVRNLVTEKINVELLKAKRVEEFQIIQGIRNVIKNYEDLSQQNPQKSQSFTCILNYLVNKEENFINRKNMLFFQIENLLAFSMIHVTALNDQLNKFEYIYGEKNVDREKHLKKYYEKLNNYHQVLINHCNQFIFKRFCSVKLSSCNNVYYKGNAASGWKKNQVETVCDAIVDYYYPKLKAIINEFENFLNKLPPVETELSVSLFKQNQLRPRKFFMCLDYNYEDFLFKFTFENLDSRSASQNNYPVVTKNDLEMKIANSSLKDLSINLEGTLEKHAKFERENGTTFFYTRNVCSFETQKKQIIWQLYILNHKPDFIAKFASRKILYEIYLYFYVERELENANFSSMYENISLVEKVMPGMSDMIENFDNFDLCPNFYKLCLMVLLEGLEYGKNYDYIDNEIYVSSSS